MTFHQAVNSRQSKSCNEKLPNRHLCFPSLGRGYNLLRTCVHAGSEHVVRNNNNGFTVGLHSCFAALDFLGSN